MTQVGKVVSFSGPGQVEVVDEQVRPLGRSEVRVRTLFSGISAGTELTMYRGTNPYLDKTWDPDRHLFTPGPATQSYPVLGAGYEEVGRVVETAGDVANVRVGDLVWGVWGHRSDVVQPAEHAAARLLDPASDPRIGMFSQIGAIALNVVLDADIHVGETVAVFGLGVPGQLVAQLARLNGARVIAVDGLTSRRELASTLGADVVLDPADGGVAEQIHDLTDGRGADACLEISGSYAALQEAIRSVAYNSRVCAGGFFQRGGGDLRLGEEFHLNRVQVVSSQISGPPAHLQHRWDRYRLAATVVRLAEQGRLHVLDLVSHTFPVDQVGAAFHLLDTQPEDALQVLLTFDSQAPALSPVSSATSSAPAATNQTR